MSVRLIVFPNILSSDRVIRDVAEGISVREAVATALPIMNYSDVIVIRNDIKSCVDDSALQDGDTLIVRAVPAGENAVGNTIKAVVSATMIIGGIAMIVGSAGALAPAGIALIAMGVVPGFDAIAGPTGIIPDAVKSQMRSPDTSQTEGSLGIHGGANTAKPYGQVPIVLGKSLISPPLGSKSYTTWDGATIPNQILNQLFVVGLGRYSIANQKIGDKAIGAFGTPPTLNQHNMTADTYGQIVTEVGIGTELTVLAGSIVQTTVADIDYIDVDISFPNGLTQYNSEGARVDSRIVTITLEYKKTTSGTWTNAAINLTPSGNVTQAVTFNNQISAATLTAAGRAGYTGTWDVRLTRTLADSKDSKLVDKSVWSVLRSYQTKEPISALAKSVTTRIKFTAQATGQLNGAVANFNVEAQSIVPVYSGSGSGAAQWGGGTALGLPSTWKNVAMNTGGFTWPTWAGSATSNPAALYLWVLRGPINPKPVPDTLIDWPAFEAWYAFCETGGPALPAAWSGGTTYNVGDLVSLSGLAYRCILANTGNTPPNSTYWVRYTLQVNAVWDSGGPLLRLLSMIAGVGRASPVMRDSKYSVWFDTVQTVPIQHFTPRNSWGFSSVKSFPQLTHAVRAQFVDPNSGWKQAEQIVYMPGYNSSTATEYRTMQFWGITDYAQVCKQVWYILAVETLRPESYQITADLEHVACQQGDLVVVSHDVPMYGLVSARVLSFTSGGGNLLTVTLDEDCVIESGKSYGLRWRRMDGSSFTGTIVTSVGTTRTLTFNGTLPADTTMQAGNLISFGIVGVETQKMIVVSVVPGDDFTARITLSNYDPNVYTADAATPPVWSSGISLPAPVGYGALPDLSVPNAQDVLQPEPVGSRAPTDTSLAFRLPLNDMLQLPDDAAGIAYQNDAAWTGWSGANTTLSVAGGVLTSVATTTDPYLAKTVSFLGKRFVIVRWRHTVGAVGSGIRVYGNAGATSKYIAITPVLGQWQTTVFDMAAPTSGTWVGTALTQIRLDFPDNPPSLPCTVEFAFVYVGNGNYASKNVYYETDGSAADASNPWSITGTGSVTFSSGAMVIATTANGSYAVKSLAGLTIPTSGRIRFSARQTAGALGTMRFDVVGGGVGTAVVNPALSASFQNYELTWTGAFTGLNFLITNYAAQTYTLEVDWLDISDGLYGPVLDDSINGIKLSCQNGVTRIDGPRGYAFDATYGALSTISTPVGIPAGSSDRTFAIWFKRNGTPGTFIILTSCGAGVGTAFTLQISPSADLMVGFNGSNTGTLSILPYLDDNWHLAGVSLSGTTMSFYVDGILIGTKTATVNTVVENLVIGNLTGNPFLGQLTVPQIWGRALSAAEHLGLFLQAPSTSPKSVETAVATRAPGYLGSGALLPINPDRNDFCLITGVAAGSVTPGSGTNNCEVALWNGSVWVLDSDASHFAAAGNDILVWLAAATAHLPPTGWNFIDKLIGNQAFFDKIAATTLTVTGTINANAGYFKGELQGAYGALGAFSSDKLAYATHTYPIGTTVASIYADLIAGGLVANIWLGMRGTYGGVNQCQIRYSTAGGELQVRRADSAVTNIGSTTIASVLEVSMLFSQNISDSSIIPRGRNSLDMGSDAAPFNKVCSEKFYAPDFSAVTFSNGIYDFGSGYLEFSDGTMIQWGTVSITTSTTIWDWFGSTSGSANYGTATVAWPMAWASGVTPKMAGADNYRGVIRFSPTTTNFTAQTFGNGGIGTFTAGWVAIGRWI